MSKIEQPKSIDLSQYAVDAQNPARFYGLPAEIQYCARCVYSNQKPNSAPEFEHTQNSKKQTVALDDENICAACRIAEQKQQIDWSERERELRELCDRFRRSDGHYDCLVPGSGGKDSFYAAHRLKYDFGMNPLTVTWAPHIYTDWGWRNFEAWMHAGFDNYLFTPNGRVHRLMTRLALERLLHPFQPFMMGQMYFPPKMAITHDIPLVFYGENPVEYGNPTKKDDTALKEWAYFTSNDTDNVFIAGTKVSELYADFGLSKVDLDPYMPPDPQMLTDRKIEVRYLGYYLRWHPQSNYYYSVEHGGFEAAPERTSGTYSKYSSIDDKIDDLHYYTTYIKFGIGRASYDASQEVRSGDITRDEALALARRFDGEYPSRFETECLRYLSLPRDQFAEAAKMFERPVIDSDYFKALCDSRRSPHLWKCVDGQWSLRHTPWDTVA